MKVLMIDDIPPGCEALLFISRNIEEVFRCNIVVINNLEQLPGKIEIGSITFPTKNFEADIKQNNIITYIDNNPWEVDYNKLKAAARMHTNFRADFIGGRQNKYGKKFIR